MKQIIKNILKNAMNDVIFSDIMLFFFKNFSPILFLTCVIYPIYLIFNKFGGFDVHTNLEIFFCILQFLFSVFISFMIMGSIYFIGNEGHTINDFVENKCENTYKRLLKYKYTENERIN